MKNNTLLQTLRKQMSNQISDKYLLVSNIIIIPFYNFINLNGFWIKSIIDIYHFIKNQKSHTAN